MEFKPWGDAQKNYNRIIKSGNEYKFISDLENSYPDGISETTLNVILWDENALCFQYIDNEFLTADEIKIKNK